MHDVSSFLSRETWVAAVEPHHALWLFRSPYERRRAYSKPCEVFPMTAAMRCQGCEWGHNALYWTSVGTSIHLVIYRHGQVLVRVVSSTSTAVQRDGDFNRTEKLCISEVLYNIHTCTHYVHANCSFAIFESSWPLCKAWAGEYARLRH